MTIAMIVIGRVFPLLTSGRVSCLTWVRGKIRRGVGIGKGVGKAEWRGRKGLEESVDRVDWQEGKPEGGVMLIRGLVQVVPQLLGLVRNLEGGDRGHRGGGDKPLGG